MGRAVCAASVGDFPRSLENEARRDCGLMLRCMDVFWDRLVFDALIGVCRRQQGDLNGLTRAVLIIVERGAPAPLII